MSTPKRVIDKHGDVWTLGDDGLMHTPETAPFPLEYVEKKWGPLRPAARYIGERDFKAEQDELRNQVRG